MIDIGKTMSHFETTEDYYKAVIADLKSEIIAMRCCGNCEQSKTRTGLICQNCINKSNWSKKT